jgi:hypothetical protein
MKKYIYIKSDEFKFIYFITPKAGSRTIVKYLKNLGFEFKGDKMQELDFEKHQDYFKFGFTRNPWDRMVSVWKNKVIDDHETGVDNLRKFKDFKVFLKKACKNNLEKCDNHIKLQAVMLPWEHLNHIGDLYSLNEDFKMICDKLGIELQQISHENKSEHKPYAEYYDEETKQIVAEKYAKDIECFGYKFEGK